MAGCCGAGLSGREIIGTSSPSDVFKTSAMTLTARMTVPTTRESFEKVADRLLPTLYRVAQRMTSNAADAEDLVSQTLLAAARGWKTFDGRFPKTWLVKVMRNQHLHNVQRKQLETAVLDDTIQIPDDTDVWREVDLRLVRDRIVTELDRLPEEYRWAVVLCDVEQMDYAGAAAALDVPIGTLRSRLHRGRHLLRQRLAHLIEETA